MTYTKPSILTLAALLFSGCDSVVTQHTATPVPDGDTKIGVYVERIGALGDNMAKIVAGPMWIVPELALTHYRMEDEGNGESSTGFTFAVGLHF